MQSKNQKKLDKMTKSQINTLQPLPPLGFLTFRSNYQLDVLFYSTPLTRTFRGWPAPVDHIVLSGTLACGSHRAFRNARLWITSCFQERPTSCFQERNPLAKPQSARPLETVTRARDLTFIFLLTPTKPALDTLRMSVKRPFGGHSAFVRFHSCCNEKADRIE